MLHGGLLRCGRKSEGATWWQKMHMAGDRPVEARLLAWTPSVQGSDQLASWVWGLQDSAEVSRGCVPSWSGTLKSTETPGGPDEITAWAIQIQKCGTTPSPRDQANRWPLSGVGKAVTLLVSFI